MNFNEMKYKVMYLKKYIGKKKVALWGCGTIGEILIEVLKVLNIPCEICLDNNVAKQLSSFKGIDIKSPEYLNGKSQDIYVLVAMTYYYSEVLIQLQEYGYLVEEKDFYYFGKFKDINIELIQDYSDSFGNQIIGTPKYIKSRIEFKGRNNKIFFGTNVFLQQCNIIFYGNNGYCYIGNDSHYKGQIFIGSYCSVNIGKRLIVTNNCFISVAEKTDVTIGDDCMFATNNQLRSHDSHPIFDIESGKRLNVSKSIKVEDHVWLAYGAVLLSGAWIQTGSIIGHSSVVKSKIPNNCIAVGSPARVIKRNIAWDKMNLQLMSYYLDKSDYVTDRKYWKYTTEEDLK